MKCFRYALLAVVVLTCVSALHADSIKDPRIVIRDPKCPWSGCVDVGQSFTFSSPESGKGSLFFTNTSGMDWFNLKLTEIGVPANAITCVTDAFANCAVSTAANGITTILLSGLDCYHTGIGAGKNFSITFGCAHGDCDPWPGDLKFIAHANVPEPTTMALMLGGLALVARKKLRRKNAASIA